jgi:hypothetical protein
LSNIASSAANGATGVAAGARVAAPVDRHAATNSSFASMFKQCIQASARPLPSVASSSNDVLGGPAAGNEGLQSASTDRLHGIHICHCLVVDTALFALGSEASKKHSAVLAASSDEVLALVSAWQPQLIGVACAMVRSARVHVQFRTHTDMAASLKISPLLVQCELLQLVGERKSVVLLVMTAPKSWSLRAHPTTACSIPLLMSQQPSSVC